MGIAISPLIFLLLPCIGLFAKPQVYFPAWCFGILIAWLVGRRRIRTSLATFVKGAALAYIIATLVGLFLQRIMNLPLIG